MSITVECPHCETRFHKLQPELRGKQMLCPVCRETFVVREVPPGEEDDVLLAEPVEESGPPPTGKGRSRADAPEPAYRSGNVGDLLPILDVEVVPDDPAPPRKGGPREVVWSEGQPPPKEVVWGEAEPGGRRAAPEAAVAEQEADDEYLYMRRRRKRRRMVLVVWGLIAVVVGIGSYGVYVLIQDWLRKEQHLAKEAQDLYAEGNYGAARERFATLLADFPDSNHKRLYDFFHDLSDVRALVYSVAVRSDPGPSVGALTAFLEKWRDDAFLKPDGYAVDVWNTTRKLGEEVVGHAEDRAKEAGSELAASQDGSRDEAITGLLDRAERWVGEAKKLAPLVERFRPENAPAGNLAAEADRVAALAGTSRANLHALQQVEKLAEDPTEANVAEIDSIVATFDIGSHPRVRQVRDQLTVVRGKRVGFDPDPAAPVPLRDDGPPGLRFAPLLERGKPSGDPPDELGGTSVFFALARGVLYALDEADGSVRWTARVGIDTTSLPLRVPASDQNPEVVLVASNDGRRFGLTARLAESGAVLWHQPLAAPCVGSPVRVGQRVYAATADAEGTIYEIEISGGHRLGRVVTGHPLGGGGVHRPGTGLIYFPAEGYFVYALDVDRAGPDGARLPPVLAGVLETKHPPRSLRGEPVLLPPEVTGTGAAHLILSQFEGNDSVRLRAFALPEPGAGGGELTPAAEAELPGWNWFTPYHDTEKLAVATDRGAFGLFGIAQPGNADPVLFPMLPGPFRFRPDSPEPSRGLVAHAGEDRFWVLARGALHRLEFGLTTVEGLKLVESGTPLPLGAPLHAGQVNARGDTVLVVTQAEGSPACLATAFDPRSGRVRWQRQLGVLALGDPVRAGEEWVLAGRSGELYRFGPEPTLTRPDAAWQSDPRRLVAPPVKGVAGEPALVPAADGRSVYSVVPLRRGERHSVLLRHYRPGEGGAAGEYPVDLPAAPAGRPIELGGYLLLPLEDGTIHRLAVPGGRMPEAGPTWRETARLGTPVCHLARLSGEEFLATDGDRTLTRRRWPAGGDFALVGQVTLPARIDRPPLVLPGGPGQPDRVVVADRSGTVSLFAANKLDRPLRTWKPGDGGIPEGRVTRGPFPLGGSVGYVAGGRYLVRLDLSGDRPRWVHDAGGGGGANAIVGEPRVIDGVVWLARESGSLVGLNAETGEPVGPPLPLPPGLAPATTPVELGPERVLLPLTDGTVVLPKVRDAPAPPVLWLPGLLPVLPPVPVVGAR